MGITMRRIAELSVVAALTLVCRVSLADETCSARVQNNDQSKRTITHLRIAASDQASSREETVVVNRIVLPDASNIAIIHWNCSDHKKSYQIVGMTPEGQDMVSGTVTPTTMDVTPGDRPLAQLNTVSTAVRHD